LTAYAFAYDRLRIEAGLLEKSSDFKKISTALLRYKVQDLGFSYEPTLGDTYHRSVYRSGNIINSTKGTSRGISAYTTALTHWDTDIRVGHNLMLDYNDSSFEESIGRWGISGLRAPGYTPLPTPLYASTLTHQKYSTSLADLGVTVTPPSPGLYDPVFPPRNSGFMAWKGPATGSFIITRYFRLPAETGSYAGKNDVQKGIPVTPGKRYIFTPYKCIRHWSGKWPSEM
jgi:hypothetical protein